MRAFSRRLLTGAACVALIAAVGACAPNGKSSSAPPQKERTVASAPIKSVDPNTQPVANRRLDRAEIREAQSLLNKLGYEAGPADGIVGRRSKRAAIDYQTQIGVASDGVFDTLLLARLRNSAETGAGAASGPATASAAPAPKPKPKPKPKPAAVKPTESKPAAAEPKRDYYYDGGADGGGGGGGGW